VTLAMTPEQATALAELRRLRPELRMVLVGAAALQHHVELRRATRDVDLAVVAEQASLAAMLEGVGWAHGRRDPPHRWRKRPGPESTASGEVIADFLPATDEILRVGSFRATPEDEPMSMVGFDLALAHSVAVALGTSDQQIEVATLPVLVLLKIVAWLDSPARRARDLGDVAVALERGLPVDDPRRWDDAGPLVRPGLDFEDQGAFHVGHELRALAGPVHREHVARFLARVGDRDDVPFAQMLREWGVRREDAEPRLAALLQAFERGFGR